MSRVLRPGGWLVISGPCLLVTMLTRAPSGFERQWRSGYTPAMLASESSVPGRAARGRAF